jgi:hypothetical protein
MLGKIYKKTEEELKALENSGLTMESLTSKLVTEVVFTRFLLAELGRTLLIVMYLTMATILTVLTILLLK